MMRISSDVHISDTHSHCTYATHETRAQDKPASVPGGPGEASSAVGVARAGGYRPSAPRQQSFRGTTAI
eukprot:5283479-Prymnesium_polylepis.1